MDPAIPIQQDRIARHSLALSKRELPWGEHVASLYWEDNGGNEGVGGVGFSSLHRRSGQRKRWGGGTAQLWAKSRKETCIDRQGNFEEREEANG